jgi:endonuclease YncB( thermonuclease family)
MKIEPLKPLNNEDYEMLIKSEDAPLFSLNYQTHLAKVIDVHDGDTITAIFFLKGELRKYKVRIVGIDTAELKDSDPEVAELAKQTVLVIAQMKSKVVKAELGKFDKYGRVLSRIFAQTIDGEIDVSKWMIEKGIAKPYYGKTKSIFTKADVNRLKGIIEVLRFP